MTALGFVLAQTADFDDAQAVVFLHTNTFDNTIGACVAVAISKTVLVTSAECVAASLSKNKLPNNRVLLGSANPSLGIKVAENNAANFDKIAGANTYNPSDIIIHENYNPLTKADNIALLIVSNTPAKISKVSVQELDAYSSVLAVGVGQTLPSKQNTSPALNSTNIAVYPEQTCKDILTSFSSTDFRTICAGAQTSICGLDGAVFLPAANSYVLYAVGSFTGTPKQPHSWVL
ncbi:hypothetical protein BB561_001933 [Smittium simulii]|uniref:Peptidase S1 domain-containing protein n=1 Tax=Smittium simulii TaxID=133385 RepID=A0A2T9YSE6_9FUNG|nr:hypothetical protein BB561_001933 [Smittium simulii]